MTNIQDYIQDYINQRIDETFSVFGVMNINEDENTIAEEDPSPIDVLFKKSIVPIIVSDALKFTLKTAGKFSTGNQTDLERVHKKFLNKVYTKAKDYRISDKDKIFKVLRAAGLYTPAGFGNTIASEADKLVSHGFSYANVKEGRSKDKHRIHGKNLIASGKYNSGIEIDLDYIGDGFEDCDHNVVVRSQDGQGPMIMYGYNGKFISNDVRSIYAYETGLPYMWCSGIQLEKWKKADDDRKRSCARDKTLII